MPALPATLALRADPVFLRDWRDDDAPALAPVCGDPDVCRFTSVPWAYTSAAARTWIAGLRARRAAGTGLVLAITEGDDGPPLGTVNLVQFSVDDRQAALGYWLLPAARRSGLATVAARTLCDWGFEHLSLERIELAILPDNVASQRVAARLGATPEGLRRDSHEADGRSWDMLIYSLAAPGT